MDEIKYKAPAEHWVAVEQVILGSVLLKNELYHSLASKISDGDFYDPVHVSIWQRIRSRIDAGHVASPISVSGDLATSEGFKELGGATYLVRMAGTAVMTGIDQYAIELKGLRARQTFAEAFEESMKALAQPDGLKNARERLELVLAATPVEQGKDNAVSMLKAVTDAVEEMNTAFSGGVVSIGTGIKELDRKTGGLFKGDYICIAGRPSMGKTALGLHMGLNAARANQKVVIASLEMTESSLANRAISEQSGVPYSEQRRGDMDAEKFKGVIRHAKEVMDLPIGILPSHVRDVASIMGACRGERQRLGGLDLVIVDYLQLLRAAGKGRTEQMTEVSIQLKAMAKILDVPVIVISQLSRGVESRDNKRPMLSDLRETGQIEQDADMVLFCYRDSYYLEREGEPKTLIEADNWRQALDASKGKMEIIIAKQRMGGLGTVKVNCDLPTNRFSEIPKQEDLSF